MSKEDISNIIEQFVKLRRSDESRGNDGNRRYSLSGLSEVDYPKISKVINGMIADNEGIKKYLWLKNNFMNNLLLIPQMVLIHLRD